MAGAGRARGHWSRAKPWPGTYDSIRPGTNGSGNWPATNGPGGSPGRWHWSRVGLGPGQMGCTFEVFSTSGSLRTSSAAGDDWTCALARARCGSPDANEHAAWRWTTFISTFPSGTTGKSIFAVRQVHTAKAQNTRQRSLPCNVARQRPHVDVLLGNDIVAVRFSIFARQRPLPCTTVFAVRF